MEQMLKFDGNVTTKYVPENFNFRECAYIGNSPISPKLQFNLGLLQGVQVNRLIHSGYFKYPFFLTTSRGHLICITKKGEIIKSRYILKYTFRNYGDLFVEKSFYTQVMPIFSPDDLVGWKVI